MINKNNVILAIVLAGIISLTPVTYNQIQTTFANENEIDTEIIVGNALELSFLLAKNPEPNEIDLELDIKHGNELTHTNIIYNKGTNEIIFDENKYFETVHADFYYDEDSIEVVFVIYFSKALEISGFTVTATDINGMSSEIKINESLNVKRAKKSINLHSIAEYNHNNNQIREPLPSIEFIISPNPFGEGNLHVVDGGINDDDGKNDGSVLLSQIPSGLYTVILQKNEITIHDDVDLFSMEPPKIINVGVHSFNPTLTYLFKESTISGYEEPQIIDANFGDEFEELANAGACLIDSETGECILISDPNQLSYAIVGDQNIDSINDLNPVEIKVNDDIIPQDNNEFSIVEAEQFLPVIKTPDSSLNQATLLPTLSVFDENTDSLYAFSSGVHPEDLKDNAIIVKIGKESFEEGRGGVQQAIIRGASNLQIPDGENKPEVFSFRNTDEPGTLDDGTPIPPLPTVDNFLNTPGVESFETYIDVETRYEQGDQSAVNWHDSNNFEEPPTIRIVIPAVLPEDAQTQEQSGYEVFSMDENHPMYLIPKPIIFMLDEEVSPPKWVQNDVIIFQETCERISDDHAICEAEIPHYSRFGIGGIKSLALGNLIRISDHDQYDKDGFLTSQDNVLEPIEEIIQEQINDISDNSEVINEEITDADNIIEQSEININKNDDIITQTKIPTWVKETAFWWLGGLIDDEQFISSVKYLHESGTIRLESNTLEEESKSMISIKNEIWDWCDGYIEDEDVIDSINLLINDNSLKNLEGNLNGEG